jgi:rRNA-processing protein FCF1
VDVIVYVETNFLMSVAMGREARGDDLLAAVSASVRVAIPSGCYMESFSAFEDEQKRRIWFRAEREHSDLVGLGGIFENCLNHLIFKVLPSSRLVVSP